MRNRAHPFPSPFLSTLPLILTLGFSSILAPPVSAQNPPPIPTAESREAFVRSQQAAFEAWTEAGPPRAVHDEYDVLHYDVALNLDIGAHVITGTVGVRLKAEVPGLTQVALDLYSPMVVDAVTVDGVAAPYTHAGGVITVTLAQPLAQGDSTVVSCAYHGTPSYTGSPFRWMTHGSSVPMVLSYSEPYGAPAWWVCKDDPKDKATFAVHVTAPDTLVTVSNGILASVVQNPNHTATYHWTHNYPMSTYLFSIATTNFASWTEVYTALDQERTMNVDYFAYPEDLARAQIDWSRNIEMMEYYAGIFGEYPFLSEKYAIAEFQHPGAMEHQTATSMGWGWITGTNVNDFVVAHELSHSWVGDMITMREYSHAWTKEGFATFCEALYFEDLYGPVYYHSYMNGMNVINYALPQLYNINPPMHAAIYYKGAWVLHMLRRIIGDPAFFSGMSGYTNDPALMYGCSDTEGLREAFELSSDMDLTWFFDEWIYHPGYPKFVQSWSSTPATSGYDVALSLYQVQTVGPIFKMPIDVRIVTDAGDERFVIWDSLYAQTFNLHVNGTPQSLTLDPDGWLIKQVLTGTEAAEAGPRPGALTLWIGPNPSRPPASIAFSLPGTAIARLQVFDASGRRVRTLFDRAATPGMYQVTWDGRGEGGSPLPSGIYYHRLDQEARTTTGRVLLLR